MKINHSMMDYYYGIDHADQFEELFKEFVCV